MVIGLGADTGEGIQTSLADAVQHLIHNATGQRLGHGEEEINIPHAIDACRGLLARFCLELSSGGINRCRCIDLTEYPSAQVFLIGIMHRTVIAVDIAVGNDVLVGHSWGIHQESGDKGAILTHDERSVKTPIALLQVFAPKEKTPHIGRHAVGIQEFIARNDRRCSIVVLTRVGQHIPLGILTLVVERKHIQVIVNGALDQAVNHIITQAVITVHKQDITATGIVHGQIAGSAHTRIFLLQQSHLTVFAGESLDNTPAAIGRAVINDQHLVVIGPKLLVHNRLQTPQHIALGVIHRDYVSQQEFVHLG